MKQGTKIQYAGWFWIFFGNTIILVILGLLFPKTGANYLMSWFYFSEFIGVMLVLFGFRQNRVLKEKRITSWKDIVYVIRHFSKIQNLIMNSSFWLAMVFLFDSLGLEVLASGSMIIFFAFDLILLVVLYKKFIKWIKRLSMVKTTTNTTSGYKINVAEKPIVCERCGGKIARQRVNDIDGHIYCDKCLEQITAPTKLKRCCLCGDSFDEKELTFIDGEYYCEQCVKKHYEV